MDLLSDFWELLITGVEITVPLTLASFAIGLVLAFFLAVFEYANIKVLSAFSKFYIWLFRGTPLLVQLLILFYAMSAVDSWIVAVVAFSLNVAAYNAEAIRGAMLSVPKGQLEAGWLIGLKYPQILFRIVVPQALPISLPSLFNNLISLLKDTSLASSIMVIELLGKAKRLAAGNYQHLKYYCLAAVAYLIFCTFLTWLEHFIEKRFGWKTNPGKLAELKERLGRDKENA